MSEFGGLWKHEINQHALVPPKTECGCPSGGGTKKGQIRNPSYGQMQGKKSVVTCMFCRFRPLQINRKKLESLAMTEKLMLFYELIRDKVYFSGGSQKEAREMPRR